MKKLKSFQKFALSAEQASKVKGGMSCWFRTGNYYTPISVGDNPDIANGFCVAAGDNCAGCF